MDTCVTERIKPPLFLGTHRCELSGERLFLPKKLSSPPQNTNTSSPFYSLSIQEDGIIFGFQDDFPPANLQGIRWLFKSSSDGRTIALPKEILHTRETQNRLLVGQGRHFLILTEKQYEDRFPNSFFARQARAQRQSVGGVLALG